MSERVVVVGCGGIGGVVAAHLTRAGIDVTPVTGNAAIATAIADRGFRVKEFDGAEWSAPPARPPVVAPEGGPYDVALVATKATTIEDALRAVLPHLREDAPVVLLQNGLPEEIAARVVEPRRLYGCVVGWGATMALPGVYERTSRGGFQVGRAVAQAADPARIARLFEPVAPATVVQDLAAVRWSKLAINCATSTVGAIGGRRLGALLSRRFVRRLVLELWSEVVAVARAEGVKMAPVGGTMDIEKMALTPADRAAKRGSRSLAAKHAILLAVGMKYRRLRSSMLVAIERGRTPEIDFLNGEIVRRGAARGVATPVNALLVETVRRVAAGRARPSLILLRAVYDELMLQPPTKLAA